MPFADSKYPSVAKYRQSHTPGPWVACEPDADSSRWEVASESHLLATIWNNDPAGAAANARLIAAAPDLLKACRAIDRAYDRTDSWTEGRAMRMVMSAIAKAEGRS